MLDLPARVGLTNHAVILFNSIFRFMNHCNIQNDAMLMIISVLLYWKADSLQRINYLPLPFTIYVDMVEAGHGCGEGRKS